MKPTVVRKVSRPDADLVKTLRDLGVATVHEAQARTGLMRPYLRPIYLSAKAAGSAITISCHPGDNLMIHAAIEFCKEGDILVVSTTSESTEQKTRERLKSGELGVDFYGLRAKLSELGVRYADELEEWE